MRLINTRTLQLEEFQSETPRYAILSHTWGDEEVSFEEWQWNFSEATTKAGFIKIQSSCQRAFLDGYEYLWCDTNCIDKRSSAELSEAINSMFAWYKNSEVCYAYLADVPPDDSSRFFLSRFYSSRWFTRGWTLQELLAPTSLIFFAQDWSVLGSRTTLSKMVFEITRIKEDHMGDALYHASISERMSWVSRRNTSRVEDIAYCMLGIFDINMPLLYGEGPRAFVRLQEEIIRVSNDQSIFCWHWDKDYVPIHWSSILSPSPKTFEHSGSYCIARRTDDTSSFSMNNAGLSINLVTLDMPEKERRPGRDRYLAVLNVYCREANETVGLVLRRRHDSQRFMRQHFPPGPVPTPKASGLNLKAMCIDARSQGCFGPSSRESTHVPNFGVLVAGSSFSSVNRLITTYPRPNSYFGMHVLYPLGSGCHGTAFSLSTTVDRQTGNAYPISISVTAICFVGVEVQNYTPRWGCKVLEIYDAAASTLDVGKIVSYHESRIRRVVHDTSSFITLNFASISDLVDERIGIGMSMVLGPSIKVSGNSRLAVAHVQLPFVRRYINDLIFHRFSF